MMHMDLERLCSLSPAMLRDLARSGIDAHTAAHLGLRYNSLSNSYRFPYIDWRSGKPTGFWRERYLHPDALNKYEQPRDTPPQAYFPPMRNWAYVSDDISVQIIVTEGEKKAIAACLNGYHAIALGGVDSWRSRKYGIALLPELAAFNWRDRRVTILFDSDPKAETRWHTHRAATMLSRKLETFGAVINVAWLPTENGQKVGLDDFLAQKNG